MVVAQIQKRQKEQAQELMQAPEQELIWVLAQ
jgi:hypothetical protein